MIQNCDNKLILRQNIVCSVKKFTQALKVLHEPGLHGSQHFASLPPACETAQKLSGLYISINHLVTVIETDFLWENIKLMIKCV